MRRTEAREYLMKLFYQMEAQNDFPMKLKIHLLRIIFRSQIN